MVRHECAEALGSIAHDKARAKAMMHRIDLVLV